MDGEGQTDIKEMGELGGVLERLNTSVNALDNIKNDLKAKLKPLMQNLPRGEGKKEDRNTANSAVTEKITAEIEKIEKLTKDLEYLSDSLVL
jgi:chromosome segregation ATPase